jgi:hypothetical protein
MWTPKFEPAVPIRLSWAWSGPGGDPIYPGSSSASSRHNHGGGITQEEFEKVLYGRDLGFLKDGEVAG